MSALKVMIVDDHRVMREGLRKVLETFEDIEVVGEAGEGKEAVDRAQQIRPDVVLMDVLMPGMNGIDACHEIKSLLPGTAVLMLTASGETESVTSSLVAGADGYVLKVGGQEELVRAIRAVGRGESVLDPSVTRIVTEGFSRLVTQEMDQEVRQLTPREKEVLLLVAQGATNKEVAEKLVLSEFTARNTVSNILSKLALRNRSELVRWALAHKIVGKEPIP